MLLGAVGTPGVPDNPTAVCASGQLVNVPIELGDSEIGTGWASSRTASSGAGISRVPSRTSSAVMHRRYRRGVPPTATVYGSGPAWEVQR